MADGAMRLERAAPPVKGFEAEGCRLIVEHDLAIAKLRIHGPEFDARFSAITGFAPPAMRQQVERMDLRFAWLAPGEWLITGSEATVSAWLEEINCREDDELIALDVTHALTSFLLEGPDTRTVLAAHCPLDLWPTNFPVGAVARSLLGVTGIFIARLGDSGNAPRFRLVVDQTTASYAVRLLTRSKFPDDEEALS